MYAIRHKETWEWLNEDECEFYFCNQDGNFTVDKKRLERYIETWQKRMLPDFILEQAPYKQARADQLEIVELREVE